MKALSALLPALLVSLMSATASADSAPAHFKGEPADTLARPWPTSPNTTSAWPNC
jgi:hypothetical protein